MKTYRIHLITLPLLTLSLLGSAEAALYEAVSFAAPGYATTGPNINTPPAALAVDFGSRGTGTFSFGFSGGTANTYFYVPTDNLLTAGSFTMDNGDTLAIGNNMSLGVGTFPYYGASTTTPSYTMSFSLDSGTFKTGDVLLVGNLTRWGDYSSTVQPGAAFGGADITMNTPFSNATAGIWGSDANGEIYTVLEAIPDFSTKLASDAVAFRLNQDTSSFTVNMQFSGDFGSGGQNGGGITPLASASTQWTIGFATPVVPEPSAIILAGLSAVGIVFRRKRQISSQS